MTSDRELLEYAAKAVWGYFPTKSTERGVQIGLYSWWNPLTDDGDAFRLAVKLRLNIEFTRALGPAWNQEHMQVSASGKGHLAESGPLGDNPNATIRRAIVRAAAEIGRNMSG